MVEDIQWHFNKPVKSVVENLTKKKLNRSIIGVVGLGSNPNSKFNGISEKMPEANLVDVSSGERGRLNGLEKVPTSLS